MQSLQLKIHSIMTGPILNTSHIVLKQNLPLKETEQSLKSKNVKGHMLLIAFHQATCLDEEFPAYYFQEFQAFIQNYDSIN